MPQLMCEPAATLMKSGNWNEEEWIIVPKNNTDQIRAFRAEDSGGNGEKMDVLRTAQHYGFIRGNRLVKDIVLGLYNQALVGGSNTLHEANGIGIGWSRKSVLADLLTERYRTVWLSDGNGKWVIYETDGTTVQKAFDTLHDAIAFVIGQVVSLLNRGTEG